MATAYLSPGVYVEEVDRGSKPIEGVGTAVAAFIGFAENGPVGQPMLVTNWSQFTNTFGGFVKGSYLAPSVYGYFNNGGGTCYVTRLPGEISNGHSSNGQARQTATAALPSRGGAALPTLEFTALEPGAAGAEPTVEVRAPERARPTTVHPRRQERRDRGGVPQPDVGKGRAARNVVEVVNRESKLVKVAEKEATGSLAERAPALGNYVMPGPRRARCATRTRSLPAVKTERHHRRCRRAHGHQWPGGRRQRHDAVASRT